MKRMNKAETLDQALYQEGIEVFYGYISHRINGVYVDEHKSPYIVINPNLVHSKQTATLAHEAGHHFTGLTGHTGRDEERANRWAVNHLLSPQDIIEATKSGCRSYYEVGEYLHLPAEFIEIAVEIMAVTYGRTIELKAYTLHLLPIWVEDRETGQVWPAE